jgi:hypothetical protein
MRLLKIDATKLTPAIVMDPERHTIEISGFSLPEDAIDFYQPIINWLKEYREENKAVAQNGHELNVYFKLTYFNSASMRLIVEIFEHIGKMLQMGFKVNVNWKYDSEDPQMAETGRELGDITKVPVLLTNFDN